MDSIFDSMNIIFLVVGILFFLVGFILFIATIRAIIKSNSSKKWPVADGVILKSELIKDTIKSPGNPPTPNDKPEIEFSYSINGKITNPQKYILVISLFQQEIFLEVKD